jgi:pSer/pThr/pTyr-binding forkhead associated (FHA) protein
MISRHHCALIVEGSTVAVRDFGSKNGTYVNGQRIGGETVLTPGDQLSIGPLRFEVVIEHQVGGKKKPKVKDVQEAALRTAATEPGFDDVSQWLTDDSDSNVHGGSTIHGQELTMSDTRTLASEDTGIIGSQSRSAPEDDLLEEDEGSETSQAAASTKEHKREPEKKEKSGWLSKLRGGAKKPEAGKLPTSQRPTAADTTEAAGDMLRKMTKKR